MRKLSSRKIRRTSTTQDRLIITTCNTKIISTMLTQPLTQIIDQFRMADHTLGAQDLLFESLDSSFFKLVVGERKVHETGGFLMGLDWEYLMSAHISLTRSQLHEHI